MVGDGLLPDKNWILSLFDMWRPRKATVTAVDGSGVKVHVDGEDTARPHTYTPSIDGLSIGDAGVLHPMKGTGVGQFIPVNVPLVPPHNHDDRYYTEAEVNALLALRRPQAGGAFIETTYSTGSDHLLTAAKVEFTGLPVGESFGVSFTATFIASGSGSASGSFGVNAASNGSNASLFPYGYGVPISTNSPFIASFSTTRTVGGDGKIILTPVLQRNAGSIYVQAAYLTANLS